MDTENVKIQENEQENKEISYFLIFDPFALVSGIVMAQSRIILRVMLEKGCAFKFYL